MADNIVLNAGAGGATLAADDISSVWYQIAKLAFGALDTATLVSTSAGLPVQQQGSWVVDSHAVTNAGTFSVQASSVIPGVAATSLGKAEDAAHSSGDTGVMLLAVREATVADLSAGATDGDYEPLQVSAAGRLWVSATVDAALPAGTNAIGKLAANSGVTIGAIEIAAAQTLATVTNVATIGTSVTPGTAAGNLGKAEDAAHSSGDTGVMLLAVREATATDLSAGATDGDYEPLQVNASGRLWASANIDQINAVTPLMGTGNTGTGSLRVTIATDQAQLTNKLLVTPDANSAINMAQVGGTNTVTAGVNGTQAVGGNVATNVAIGTNPINNGAQGVSSENAVVTTGRMVQLVADLVGKLIVLPYSNPENFVSGAITTAMTGTTSTSLLAAPASGLRNYITHIVVSNAHATVGTDLIIQDGSGGTTLYTIPAAAVYGGSSITFPVPLRQPTTATAIFCANVTTGASTKVSATGYKGV